MIDTNLTGNRIKSFLAEGKRFDGRKLDEYRDLKIETGISKNAEGSARVRLGDTEVLVGIKMALGTPYPDSPDAGNMMVTAELLPLSSPRFENGPPKFPAIELGRVIDRGIRESKYIDFKKLCIEEGEKVWTVFIDVYTINDAGNLLDAAGIGAVAALQSAKMPKYDEKTGKVLFGDWTENSIPLTKKAPLSITIHKIGKELVLDPTRDEEDASETKVTVGLVEGVISSLQKGEIETLTSEEMEKIFELAEKAWKETSLKIEKALK